MVEKICRACGYKLSDFCESMMLGCPHCYKEFESEIESVLLNVQGSTHHVGKKPQDSFLKEELLRKYKMLDNDRQIAVLEKNFQEVGRLNKEINKIKQDLEDLGLI